VIVMNFIERSLNETRIKAAARDHARLGLEPAHDRELEALLGPPIVVAEDDLEQRRHQGRLKRSREAIDEHESVVADGPGEPPNPAKVPPVVYLLIAAVCVLTDYAGSELTAYFAGVPAAQRMFVAASFTVGALLVTSGVAYGIERLWARGVTVASARLPSARATSSRFSRSPRRASHRSTRKSASSKWPAAH
jgi:hypothetical protein